MFLLRLHGSYAEAQITCSGALSEERISYKPCGRPPQYAAAPCKLTFDLLTLKVVSKSRVTCATSVPILVFLGLSVLDLQYGARDKFLNPS